MIDYTKNQMSLVNQRKSLSDSLFQANMATPTPYDSMANTANAVADDMQGRMAQGNGGYIKAFLRGFAGGAKGAGDFQRRKFVEKYGKDVIVPLMKMNEEAIKRTRQVMQEQETKSAVAAIYEPLKHMDPQAINEDVLENMHFKAADTYERMTGKTIRFMGNDSKDPMVVFGQTEEGLEVFNMNEILDPEGLEWKRQYQEGMLQAKQQANDTQAANINLQQQNAAFNQDVGKQGEMAAVKEASKALGKDANAYNMSRFETKSIVDGLTNINQLAEGNPWLFDMKARNMAKWLSSDPDTGRLDFKEELARKFLNEQQVGVVKEIVKDRNNILYAKVNRQSVGRVTDKMLAMDKLGLPAPWEMTKESFFNTNNRLIEEYTDQFNYFDRNVQMTNDLLAKGGHMDAPGAGKIVTVQDPSTGQTMQLSEEDAQIAVSRGGVILS